MKNAFTILFGALCLTEVLMDAFQTIILPRRASGRLRISHLLLSAVWFPSRVIAGLMKRSRSRESFLSYFGPLSLVLLVIAWALGLIFGFEAAFPWTGIPIRRSKNLWPMGHGLLCQRNHAFYARTGRCGADNPFRAPACNV